MVKNNNFKECNKGYTLVELMVALAVSAIVIAGTLAGYTVFAKQYEVLNKRIEIDREVLGIITLIQKDVTMAGYKSHLTTNAMKAADALKRTSATDFSMVFDYQEKEGDPITRRLVRYSLGPGYVSADSGVARFKLYRDLRDCTTPVSGCTIATSTSRYTAGGQGEVIMDKITSFSVAFSSPKPMGPFSGVSQIVRTSISVAASRAVRDAASLITKDFKFTARAQNVSLL